MSRKRLFSDYDVDYEDEEFVYNQRNTDEDLIRNTIDILSPRKNRENRVTLESYEDEAELICNYDTDEVDLIVERNANPVDVIEIGGTEGENVVAGNIEDVTPKEW